MWKKIDSLPKEYKKNRKMFVVKAIGGRPFPNIGYEYTTDPYCVWVKEGTRDNVEFVRWPHAFPPTHYYELPTEVE